MKLKSAITEADWAGLRHAKLADYLGLGLPFAEAARAAARLEAQTRARSAWLGEQFERMGELWEALAAYWGDYFDAHPELDPDEVDPECLPPGPPEQAELDAVETAIADVRERDLWPRHLYFADV